MRKKILVTWLKKCMKPILARLYFLRKLEVTMRFRRLYKRNFQNIKFQGARFQDMIAYYYLRGKKDGFYIDIGANDGISGSNTYIFEKIGWKGICVEANPIIYKILTKYRRCGAYNVAISNQTNDDVDFLVAAADGLSGLADSMSESGKQEAQKYGNIKNIKVRTMTFDEVMSNYPDVKHIDFISLDVEGHEVSILETIDFQKYTFGFLTIEKSAPEKIMDIMLKNGYVKFMDIGSDLMFVPA